MGRAKTFDELAVLDHAMMVFWKNGYAGTTYALLEQETGLTGRSLINTYGDKDSIFLRVLDHYSDRIQQSAQDIFSVPSLQAICDFFNDIGSAKATDPRNFGCLMINSIFELHRISPDAERAIYSFKKIIHGFFKTSLSSEGIPDADGKADYLINILWGLGADIRMTGQVKTTKVTVKYVTEFVNNLHENKDKI